jgi:hypothetical protein
MVLFVIIVIIVAIVIIKKKRDEKWYDELSINEKTKIKQIDIKLKEVNSRIKNVMPKKYRLYRMLSDLSNYLTKDEEIVYFTRYLNRVENVLKNTGPAGYIYVTNKRILIVDLQYKNIPLEKVSSISSANSLARNGIIINDSSTSEKLLGINKNDVNKLIKVINEGMEKHKNISININQTTEKDVSDKIARLKALYDEGILTEYEFNVKKMELLEKVK